MGHGQVSRHFAKIVLIIHAILMAIILLSNVTGSASAAFATPQGARGTALAATATALAAKGGKTVTAVAGKSGGTATAIAEKYSATATAFANKVGATLTALAVHVDVTATLPADVASAALTSYAAQVLGTAVKVTEAGGVNAQYTMFLTQPKTSADAQVQAVDLAVTTNQGLLSNGAASLSYGTGTLTGDITIDVQGSSLGVYTMMVKTTGQLTANSALALAQTTYPALAGAEYVTYPASKGFAWSTTTTTYAIDPATRQATAYAQAIILYVVPASGGKSAMVTASVGRGDFATLIQPQK